MGKCGDDGSQSQADLDNHNNQLNPNNDEYQGSRGEERPNDWEDQVDDD